MLQMPLSDFYDLLGKKNFLDQSNSSKVVCNLHLGGVCTKLFVLRGCD